MIPDRVGPYRIDAQIGAGGMGAVYRAFDERLDRQVAVKRILAREASESRRRRFLREAKTVARLSHPAIVQVHDLQTVGDDCWIVMELVAGTSLAERLRSGPLPIDETLELGRQIASGLDHAHRAGVLHRDLKPENVMVTPDGQAKILDFGLAKPLDAGSEETNLTRPGALLGTFRSMSPEQARGLELDARSDLFSLGTLLYEMVSGTRPFEGANRVDSLTRVCTHHPPPLAEVADAIPKPLVDLIDHLLQKEPSRRPDSAAEVARRLAEITPTDSAVATWDDRTTYDDTVDPTPSKPSNLTEPQTWSIPSQSIPSQSTQSRPIQSRLAKEHGKQPKPTLQWLVRLGAMLGLLLVVGAIWRSVDSGTVETPPVVGVGQPAVVDQDPVVDQPVASAPELLRRGQKLLETYYVRQDLEAAIATFEALRQLEPQSAAAQAGLSRAYWRRFYAEARETQWSEKALAHGEKAVELDEYLSFGRISLALALLYSGEFDQAESHALWVLTLEPEHADAHRVLAEIQTTQGNLAQAEASLRRAIQAKPEEADLFDLLGGIQWRTGQTGEAELSFRRSVELAPESVSGHRNLAAVYSRQGKLGEAAQETQRALEIRPDHTLYAGLGNLYFAQGLYAEATEIFERVVESPLGAEDHRMWGNLADAYRWNPGHAAQARDAYGEALSKLEPLIEATPDDADRRSQRALFYAKRGDQDEARQELEWLSHQQALSAVERYRVAVTWEILGERDLALAALNPEAEAGTLLTEVLQDPELMELRADPRFSGPSETPRQGPVPPPTTHSGS